MHRRDRTIRFMRKLMIAVALLLLVTTASAQMHRQQPAGAMTPMHFAVSADGSVIVLASASQVVALSTASGNVAWTVKLTGTPMQIETAGNQIFVMVAGDADTMPMRSAPARTLVALSSSGTVLWSKKIDN
jgi:outer membrane protein assembly factor BamB